jgi:hypothetical protein
MHKYLVFSVFSVSSVLSATLIPLLAEIAVSSPVAAQSIYPLVENADTTPPLCYMQTADGRVLQLDRLCNNKSSVTVTASGNINQGNDSSVAQCYPPDAPECIRSKFDAPPPPAFTPSESPPSSQR